jgi:tetratricopeptide (TPR) repeat protein
MNEIPTDPLWAAFTAGDHKTVLDEAAKHLTPAAHYLHLGGMSLTASGSKDGEYLLMTAAILRPDLPHMFSNAAVVCSEHGRPEEAEAFARLGANRHPNDASLHFLLGNALMLQHKYTEGAEAHAKAVDLDPSRSDARLNLGNCLRHTNRFDDAEDVYRIILAMNPDHQGALVNLGGLIAERGREDEAVRLIRKALTFGSYPAADVVLAFILLGQGHYEEGWRLYRSRWNADVTKADRALYQRPFAPDLDSVRGKNVVVVHEQGLGDSLQFIRYVDLLKDVAGKVGILIPEPLRTLFEASFPGIPVWSDRDRADPEREFEIPMLDLPDLFGTTIDTIPNAIPYLHVPDSHEELVSGDELRVGLVWAGHKRPNPLLAAVDARRSMALRDFEPLLRMDGVKWYSLQLGEPEQQLDEDWMWDIEMSRPLRDGFSFADSAAIIKQLDFVITVDTSVAHLAAGLGVQTWVCSRFDACWRWLRGRTDSPWYPGVMRLFTQPAPGQWKPVVDQVGKALREAVEDHKSALSVTRGHKVQR